MTSAIFLLANNKRANHGDLQNQQFQTSIVTVRRSKFGTNQIGALCLKNMNGSKS